MGGTAMGLRKYLGLERRSHSRYSAAVDVEFQVWDSVEKKPRTDKVQGRLTDISPIGACLQTNHMLIQGHHLHLDNDPAGNTPLAVTVSSSVEGGPWTIKAQVLWYNKFESERKHQFDVGLSFVEVSPTEKEKLISFLRSLSQP
jgi:c-di-GMP-binding flagellar brake protein YcgR